MGASADAPEFSEQVQIRIDVFFTHSKYQLKRHSSP